MTIVEEGVFLHYYFEPVNLKQWNIFKNVKKIGHIEPFIATKSMKIGDIMVFYVGGQDKSVGSGIYAVGVIISMPYILRNSPQDYCNNKNTVNVKITRISYDKPIIDKYMSKKIFNQFRTAHVIKNVDLLVNELYHNLDKNVSLTNEVLVDNDKEGKKIVYYTTKYERSISNRNAAIALHGTVCQVCGFDFEKTYGEIGKGFIEVHHLKPLHSLDEEIVINPETDLVCLCSNCHRMIHSKKNQIITVEELRKVIRRL